MITSAPADAPPLPGLIRIGCGLGTISDEELERICDENPGWKFELDADGELVINVYAGDESSDVGAELGGQLRNWRVGRRRRTSSRRERWLSHDRCRWTYSPVGASCLLGQPPNG